MSGSGWSGGSRSGVCKEDYAANVRSILPVQMLDHELRGQTQHPIAELLESTITPRIGARALFVVAAIDFHHQVRTASDEVNYVLADRHLPPERDAEAPAAYGRKQLAFRECRPKPHLGRTSRKNRLSV